MSFYPHPTILGPVFVLLFANAAPAVSVRGAGSTCSCPGVRGSPEGGFLLSWGHPAQIPSGFVPESARCCAQVAVLRCGAQLGALGLFSVVFCSFAPSGFAGIDAVWPLRDQNSFLPAVKSL